MVGTPPRNVMWYQNWEQSDKKDFDPVKVQMVWTRVQSRWRSGFRGNPTRALIRVSMLCNDP